MSRALGRLLVALLGVAALGLPYVITTLHSNNWAHLFFPMFLVLVSCAVAFWPSSGPWHIFGAAAALAFYVTPMVSYALARPSLCALSTFVDKETLRREFLPARSMGVYDEVSFEESVSEGAPPWIGICDHCLQQVESGDMMALIQAEVPGGRYGELSRIWGDFVVRYDRVPCSGDEARFCVNKSSITLAELPYRAANHIERLSQLGFTAKRVEFTIVTWPERRVILREPGVAFGPIGWFGFGPNGEGCAPPRPAFL